MALNSIQVEWERFAEMVFRGMTPSETQREEMRKAFFAGAWLLLAALEEIGSDHVSEEEGERYLLSRKAECEEFATRLVREYAEKN